MAQSTAVSDLGKSRTLTSDAICIDIEDEWMLFHCNKFVEPIHKPGNRVPPIARLPTETLQHIFVHSIPSVPQLGFHGIHSVDSSDMDRPFPEPDPAETPLLLTQVCRRWRDVSISTSELWCSLRLRIPNYEPCGGKGKLLRAGLEAWLRNAQVQPLTIVLQTPQRQFTATSPPAPGSLWHYILPALTSHAHHWSTLVASPAIAKYLLGQKVYMPMLKTFSSRDLVYHRSPDVLTLTPSLSSLSVTTLDDKWLLPGGVAQGLRYLSLLCCDTAQEVLTVLAYFPRLLSFRVRTCWSDEPGTEHIVHPTLEELAVPPMMTVPCVTSMLTLPSLRTMVITGGWGVSHMQSVRMLLSHSSCSLQYLEFRTTNGYMDYDIDCQIEYEAEQLLRCSPLVQICQFKFERHPSPF